MDLESYTATEEIAVKDTTQYDSDTDASSSDGDSFHPQLPAEAAERLQNLYEIVSERSEHLVGFPSCKDWDYSALFPFLSFPMNNVGDPYIESISKVSTRDIERDVLAFFADLLRAPVDKVWGYVTNGGTEGNLYGMYLARELYPTGMVYYSSSTHYSVVKNLHILRQQACEIQVQENGEMDYDHFRSIVMENTDKPAIVFCNIGTTMTEAKDDMNKIKAILDELEVSERYLHADAALCGVMCPFLPTRPAFDFADGANSMSISGHKFLGSPIPCGVVLAEKDLVEKIKRDISYIGAPDTTITGSRNAFTPLMLWYRIQSLGRDGIEKRVHMALDNAAYAEAKLKEMGIPAWRNRDSITVVFPEVHMDLKIKWQLATAKGASHLICMPNVTKTQIDAILADFAEYMN
ncbi:PLP-dependent enzyme, glutamate decarboxylase [Thraustotheca clavata]|uniref:PLP-dependent enzyme, glutamate decarboxylase n=1 Tax=Thraustotheca clavata TaxID=74557 RepID=A0A1V9ZE62_9STRA|nr:PLP-dependent enzyme, glutamate decarboxylase [Thraustotheca clavata]